MPSSMAPASSPPARTLPVRFLLFLGPLVATNILQALSATLNNIYLGQLLGTRAMAAAASFLPLLMFCVSFVIGLGMGASIVVGQAWGAKDVEKVRRIAGTVVLGGLLLGVAVSAAGLAGIAAVLRGLGTPADILPQATAYAQVMLLALPPMFISILASSILRGLGDSVTPLRMLVVACAVAMVLTPALIQGWLGLPRLGVASAAWANLAASALGVAWLAWHLGRRRHAVRWAELRGHFRLDGAILKTTVRLGIPTGLFFVTGSLADLALLSLVHRHGSEATAAWGAVNQVMAYVQFPAMSIAMAATVFTAQAIGAKQWHEVDHVTRVGLALNLSLTAAVAALVALGAPLAAGLFLKDPAVVATTASLLRITVWGSIAFGMASVFTGVMRAAGTVKVPTMISLGCLAFLLVPIGWWLNGVLGLKGIWVSYPLTYACALVLQAGYFYGVWRRREAVRLA
ncbi:MAG: MATE family efflux transporter [Comamonadaceae bacterium]|nr:MAG: MATE family efflux transporter [Comamonadaceae bacterium]